MILMDRTLNGKHIVAAFYTRDLILDKLSSKKKKKRLSIIKNTLPA